MCNAIGATFKHIVGKEGINYCGFSLNWQCALGHVDMSMPKQIPDILKCLHHQPKACPQHAPRRHMPIVHGNKGVRQTTKEPDSLPFLPEKDVKPI